VSAFQLKFLGICRSQNLTTFQPSFFNYFSSFQSSHFFQKSVHPDSSAFFRLICSFFHSAYFTTILYFLLNKSSITSLPDGFKTFLISKYISIAVLTSGSVSLTVIFPLSIILSKSLLPSALLINTIYFITPSVT